MPSRQNTIRDVTYFLLDPGTAPAAIRRLAEELPSCSDLERRAAIEGLTDFVRDPRKVRSGLDVIALLEREARQEPLFVEVLEQLVTHRRVHLRRAAIRVLVANNPPRELLVQRLSDDPSWVVRRDIVRGLGPKKDVVVALSDPHWRVRHAWIAPLLQREDFERRFEEGLATLAVRGQADPQTTGAVRYLLRKGAERGRRSWEKERTRWSEGSSPSPQEASPAWWDDDPAVLRDELRAASAEQLRAGVGSLPSLLAHEDATIRRTVREAVQRWGTVPILRDAFVSLSDPRRARATDALDALLRGVDEDRLDGMARHILCEPDPTHAALGWALQRAAQARPVELSNVRERLAMEASGAARHAAVSALVGLPGGVWRDEVLRNVLASGQRDDVEALALSGLADSMPVSELRRHRPRIEDLAEWKRSWVRGASSHINERDIADELRCLAADPHARVRTTVARLATAGEGGESSFVSLRHDPDHRVREAALTPKQAEAIWEGAQPESSWRVLRKASQLLSRPLRQLAPSEPPRVSPRAASAPGPGGPRDEADSLVVSKASGSVPRLASDSASSAPAPEAFRPLGATGFRVSVLGITGHYKLPERGFARAVDAGVNLFFWEPGYQSQTHFTRSLAPSQRRELVIVCGTFAADPKGLRRDLERALKKQNLERIPVFLLLWSRSQRRLSDETFDFLQRLREEGLIGAFGFSTHDRALAASKLRRSWPVAMVRHNAAHRGAEQEVFPVAEQHGAGVIVFSTLCYGRMLEPLASLAAPTALECYQYSLSVRGVSACLSAPASLEQLEENLELLRRPSLESERIAAIQAFGDGVHARNREFAELLRWR